MLLLLYKNSVKRSNITDGITNVFYAIGLAFADDHLISLLFLFDIFLFHIIHYSQIFSTPAFWALLLAHCGHSWGYYTLLTEIPTYLKNIQHFSLEDNGFMSALPYICMSAFSFVFSPVADWLVMKGHLFSVDLCNFVWIRHPLYAVCTYICST